MRLLSLERIRYLIIRRRSFSLTKLQFSSANIVDATLYLENRGNDTRRIILKSDIIIIRRQCFGAVFYIIRKNYIIFILRRRPRKPPNINKLSTLIIWFNYRRYKPNRAERRPQMSYISFRKIEKSQGDLRYSRILERIILQL